ncbi:MAG TPA: hypothetical protein PLX17_00475 [Chitinophagaceae bacterium]|nr:hypothetical protein [Chitinophagaceae bacterium]
MKVLLICLTIVCICWIGYNIVFIVDKSNDDLLYKKYVVKSDCEFKLPYQYSLVKNESTGEYAILFMHINKFPHYLILKRYISGSDFYSNMGYDYEAITFTDSCKAKGFAKMYFKKEASENKKYVFTPVN